MAEVVQMPKLSDTMTEGVVSKWHKKVGDEVKSGDLLADIETDKATMEFESFQEGVLLHVGVKEGAAAPVDSILAILGKKGENISEILKNSAKPEKEAQLEKKEEKVVQEPAARSVDVEVNPTTVVQENTVQTRSDNVINSDRVKISPLARRLANDKGVELSRLRGSGDDGRIVKRDIETYFSAGVASTFVGKEQFSEEIVSQMRKTIARRLSESKFTAPHFYLSVKIDMDNMVEARKAINAVAPIKISFNDLVIKAAAMGLRQHEDVNVAWMGDKLRRNQHIHIGVAVAVDEGLIVPVLRFADGMTLTQIARGVASLGERARAKKLQPEDWAGNTFSISNLGMFGIDHFTAIINPPDACILAVGAISRVPVVKNNEVVPGHVMNVTLSCDHRAVDGATGARFLQTFRQLLENPVLLLGQQAI